MSPSPARSRVPPLDYLVVSMVDASWADALASVGGPEADAISQSAFPIAPAMAFAFTAFACARKAFRGPLVQLRSRAQLHEAYHALGVAVATTGSAPAMRDTRARTALA
jgi:hypothetical protein